MNNIVDNNTYWLQVIRRPQASRIARISSVTTIALSSATRRYESYDRVGLQMKDTMGTQMEYNDEECREKTEEASAIYPRRSYVSVSNA